MSSEWKVPTQTLWTLEWTLRGTVAHGMSSEYADAPRFPNSPDPNV